MTKNMGNPDRALRIILAAVLLYVAFGTGFAATGVLHWLAILVAVVFGVTALAGSCPLYTIFGLKTCKT